MENEGRVSRFFATVGEKLDEQVWYQQLKQKWEELDPQSRTYLRAAGGGFAALLCLALVISSIWSVRNLKHELAERSEILSTMQGAADELRRLRDSNPNVSAANAGDSGPWSSYFEQVATQIGIDKANLQVGEEKAGSTGEIAKEALMDITLKKVNIKQAVKYVFQLEHGGRPVKVRNLAIDTQMDPSGYLEAKLAVSAFRLTEEK